MELYAPVYYPCFRCTADRCSHSCCIGWEIDIDDATLARYRALTGALGDDLRAGIVEREEGACFALRPDGRCPMLDKRGLCRLISALGEDALCDICREHPRFYNAVGTRQECGLGAACEEAARLILTTADYRTLVKLGDIAEIGDACAFDAAAWRERVYDLLADSKCPLGERFSAIEQAFCVSAAMSREIHEDLFASLEYLDEEHRAVLTAAYTRELAAGADMLACERFFAYLVYRHTGAAQDETAFRAALGFALVVGRLFASLCAQGYTPVAAAVLLSEELEYSEENTAEIEAAILL
jgi:lysine-N-methylase